MKSTRYLKYAIGEIFLVVVGILIAFSINNWNEGRKQRDVELLLLKELNKALESDINSIENVFLKTLEAKEKSLEKLLATGGDKENISEFEFLLSYRQSKADFYYTFDSGPYDALKANGLSQLTNDSLRAEILNAYDDIFPTFKYFMDQSNVINSKDISELESDFLGERYFKGNGTWLIIPTVIVENVLQHPSFIKALKLQSAKALEQRRRIDRLLSLTEKLKRIVTSELKSRS